MDKPKLALIDADILCFRAACGNSFSIEWEPGVFSLSENFELAFAECKYTINKILAETISEDVLLCFTGKSNFRKIVLPTYKLNRVGDKPPLFYKLKDALCDEYESLEEPMLEGDDLLGILATDPSRRTCIVTIDKDLDQIPGEHFNWVKNHLYVVPPSVGERFLYKQILMGDRTDGYTGIPGCGPVTTKKLLEDVSSELLYSTVVDAYKAKGLTEEDMLQQGRVAYILKFGDYDFETKKIKPWKGGS